MAYIAYIRCSSVKSDVANQHREIQLFAEENNIVIDRYIEETISGTKQTKDRKLGKLLEEVHPGDTIICTELSRLGRSVMIVFDILSFAMSNNISIWTIHENYRLGNDINSMILAFCFSIAAQLERDMLSTRTKAALEKKKEMGVKLGRPQGAKNKTTKLSGKEPAIRILLEEGNSYAAIARMLHVDRSTLVRHVKSRMLDENGNLLPEDI